MVLAALLITACSPTGVVPVERVGACVDHPQPDMCQQAWFAVSEVGPSGDGVQSRGIRVEPVQCAIDKCWTYAYWMPAVGAELQWFVEWPPNGEIRLKYIGRAVMP